MDVGNRLIRRTLSNGSFNFISSSFSARVLEEEGGRRKEEGKAEEMDCVIPLIRRNYYQELLLDPRKRPKRLELIPREGRVSHSLHGHGIDKRRTA